VTDEPEPILGARRGWSFRRRFFALDSYGLLLLLILGSLIVSALEVSSIAGLMPVVRIVALAGTLAFALHTSGASRRTYVACGVLVTLAVVLTLIFNGNSRLGHGVQAAAVFLIIVAVLITVVRRFSSHPVVTGSSILAAICIYLFVGLAFATIYGFIAAADVHDLFGGGLGDGTSAERIYYSYITLTTTGYGDFVPATDPARMIAITEALIGQVYLVTIVALLVSNVGSRRSRGRDGSRHDGGEG
jgi:hypothetical protein